MNRLIDRISHTNPTGIALGCFRLGALFIAKVFNEKSREKIKHILEEIRWAFIEILSNIQWMDLETRSQAQMKAKMIIGRFD